MINFKTIKTIVNHSGHAHRDDFLSVCFTLALCAEYNNELNDSDVLILDVDEKTK